jgi:predicted small integral membrane protein
MTTLFGSAMLCKRAARLGVSPTMACLTYDNIVDYGSNYQFVQHVLSMDTTFPDNALKGRAITDPRLWQAAYALRRSSVLSPLRSVWPVPASIA